MGFDSPTSQVVSAYNRYINNSLQRKGAAASLHGLALGSEVDLETISSFPLPSKKH